MSILKRIKAIFSTPEVAAVETTETMWAAAMKSVEEKNQTNTKLQGERLQALAPLIKLVHQEIPLAFHAATTHGTHSTTIGFAIPGRPNLCLCLGFERGKATLMKSEVSEALESLAEYKIKHVRES